MTAGRRLRLHRWLPALVVAALAGQTAAFAASAPRLTSAARVSADDLAPSRTYLAPFLAVDPENPRTIVASAVDARSRTCSTFRSVDGGTSWKKLDATPSPPSFPYCFYIAWMAAETPLAWGRDHTLYYALAGWGDEDGGQRFNKTVLLGRSTDLGDTWTTSTVRNARVLQNADVENNLVTSIAVDTHSGPSDIVYVGWGTRYPNKTGAIAAVQVASSTDGGKTFSDPVDVGTFYKKTVKDAAGKEYPVANFFGDPQIAVGNDGTVYALYPGGTPGGFATAAPTPLLLGRSTDKGKTWDVTEATPPGNYPEGVQMLKWSPEGGSQGTLHVVYEDKPDQPAGRADRDIYYVRSTDGGRTWTKPRKLNDDQDPDALHLQVTPNLDVAPDGRVTAAWWDFRDDTGAFTNDVYATWSIDNGTTWSANTKVTDQPINRRLGVWSNGSDMRGPPAIASVDEYTIFGWDDTRLGTELAPSQDIMVRSVQFKALGAGDNTARTVAAALAGLCVAGLLLLAVALAARRRPPPAVPATAEKEPAGVS
ncbi:MAG TPA: sialidase family protein [Acidimicrobiales bacterium]|nr:sialidase family protein [Acidimicrobiales bacterium]